ncbi:hypothetical protein [Treponema pedis]|uniref:hypothetical protein n=1 Tax=Treponema pedis TaxID=409322 RepID=UPI00197F55C4|nr:hypothetical protein [Treponema pedis]QSI03714.1 hypothetical protein DYQ05_01670 [Treponema pedis]
MKQRRTVLILGMLILAVGAMVLTVSCGKVPSKYIGNYSGTWTLIEEAIPGTWEGTVDKDGKFNIKFNYEDKTENITLTVLKNGSFSGSATIEKDKLIFKGSINDKKVTGTISKDGMPVGIIIGKKN